MSIECAAQNLCLEKYLTLALSSFSVWLLKISRRSIQIYRKPYMLQAVLCSKMPLVLSVLSWMSVINGAGVLQIAATTVLNRLPLISWKQMDFLHVRSAINVQRYWCPPHSDVALYWVCNYSKSNNISVTKQGHLKFGEFLKPFNSKAGFEFNRWIFHGILKMTSTTRSNFQVGSTLKGWCSFCHLALSDAQAYLISFMSRIYSFFGIWILKMYLLCVLCPNTSL